MIQCISVSECKAYGTTYENYIRECTELTDIHNILTHRFTESFGNICPGMKIVWVLLLWLIFQESQELLLELTAIELVSVHQCFRG